MSVADTDDEYDHRSLLILYATETGYALDIAEQVAREVQRRLIPVRLVSTDVYPLEELINEAIVVFVVSTTGTGQEPRAMTPMWQMLLRADLPPDIFEEMNFAVFGLGDSSYEKFCWAAKKLSRRLLSLGARELVDRGEGDEQHSTGIEGALDTWTPLLFDSLKDLLPPVPSTPFKEPKVLPPPRIALTAAEDVSFSYQGQEKLENYHLATLSCNKRITAEDWYQDVRHIEFDFEDDISYMPGDVAVVHPTIPEAKVNTFLELMGWEGEADETLQFRATEDALPLSASIPRKTSLTELFTSHLNILAVPRRSFFNVVRHFAREEHESVRLAEFCGSEGAEEIYNYVTRSRRTIFEVLEEFRSVKIPKEYLFNVFPVLRPREFSIASSVLVYPKQVHLCVAIVRYKTRLKASRLGICSNYLAGLKPGDKLRLGIRKGFLSVPPSEATPILCIGPGTGIAPMRALIGHRIYNGSRDNTLYFGCRSESKDFHYKHEWEAHAEAQALCYRVAFSRDGPEGEKRTYVQDLMTDDAERVWDIVGRRDGWVYISGSSNKMPTAVKGSIESAARSIGGLSEEEAKLFMKRLFDDGRLFEECWS